MQSHGDVKITLPPEETAAYNQGGVSDELLDLFCASWASTLLGRISAALTESGYRGSRLRKRLEELAESQYFRDLVDDYRSHIARVGAE